MLKLYWFTSYNPQKVAFALEELGLEYDKHTVNLFTREQQQPEFLALNPRGKVPVLVDGDLTLAESNAMLAYLGEKTGRLWPDTAAGRALAHQWLHYSSSALEDPVGTVWFNGWALPDAGYPARPDKVAGGQDAARSALRGLETHLTDREFVLDDFSLVDCGLGAVLAALAGGGFDWSESPASRAYLERLAARPAWARTGFGYGL